MTTNYKTYLGNVGTALRLDAGQDITTSTQLQIRAIKPDDTVVYWDSCSVAETTKVLHTIAAGEVDAVGDWILQSKIWFGNNFFYGESAILTVYALGK